MWTIYDFLAYGIVFGCQHQGYRACPPCGIDIVSSGPKNLGNQFFREVKGGCGKTTHIEHIQTQNTLMAKRRCGGGLKQQLLLKHQSKHK
jgi:hypothetical protein